MRAELRGTRTGSTLGDLPLGRDGTIVATIDADIPPQLFAGLQQWIEVEIGNQGEATWPGLTTQTDGRFGVQLRWFIENEAEPRYDELTPLAADLSPGESLRLEVSAFAPRQGHHALEIGLVSEENGWLSVAEGNRGTLVREEIETVPFPEPGS